MKEVEAGHMVWPIACGSCVAADYGLECQKEQTGKIWGMASVVEPNSVPAPQFQSTQSLGIYELLGNRAFPECSLLKWKSSLNKTGP